MNSLLPLLAVGLQPQPLARPRARAPRMDAFQWQEKGLDQLNLLPFGVQEVLLPGVRARHRK